MVFNIDTVEEAGELERTVPAAPHNKMLEVNNTSRSIRHKLVDLLSRREHSQLELVQKLIQRGYKKSDIIPILNDLANKDWQSDLRFTEAYVRYRSQKGIGPERLAQELQEKGVSGQLIARFIYGHGRLEKDTVIDWSVIAQYVYMKKFGKHTMKDSVHPIDYSELVKQKKYMLYKGFSNKQVDEVLKAQKNKK